MPRLRKPSSPSRSISLNDSPVSHNTRLGLAKKHTMTQFLSGIESLGSNDKREGMDLSEDGASARDDVNPREGHELDGSTIAPSSQGESSSLKFNLEKHLDKYDGIQSPPLRRTGERTPQSRLSSSLKHGILRSPLGKGISLQLFRPEDDSSSPSENIRLHEAEQLLRGVPKGAERAPAGRPSSHSPLREPRVASTSHSQPNFTKSDMAEASERREHSSADSELKEADLEEITRREMADEGFGTMIARTRASFHG
ncbi:hypothetical protein R1sor_027374 [Riccia sorocarpa]|uniref:Uncharacterized protein n=1 Tax=Riccia sorocarpa TaxID=122646 RepID=A0ABD3GHP2_9MARC